MYLFIFFESSTSIQSERQFNSFKESNTKYWPFLIDIISSTSAQRNNKKGRGALKISRNKKILQIIIWQHHINQQLIKKNNCLLFTYLYVIDTFGSQKIPPPTFSFLVVEGEDIHDEHSIINNSSPLRNQCDV